MKKAVRSAAILVHTRYRYVCGALKNPRRLAHPLTAENWSTLKNTKFVSIPLCPDVSDAKRTTAKIDSGECLKFVCEVDCERQLLSTKLHCPCRGRNIFCFVQAADKSAFPCLPEQRRKKKQYIAKAIRLDFLLRSFRASVELFSPYSVIR